jgi:hypothetical protein
MISSGVQPICPAVLAALLGTQAPVKATIKSPT